MDFENIKRKMNAENMDGGQIPTKIKQIEASKMPIQKVRQSMRNEIFTQLVFILIFFAAPSFIEMHQSPKAIYYISMFITSLITLGYLAKMSWFLNRSNGISNNGKETVVAFIYDLKLTLEVYKTAIVSGSLLLPLSLIALYFGRVKMDEELFSNLILLNLPTTTLLLYVLGYLIVALLLYFITLSWSNQLYGVHIKNLEKTLKEFEA
ncbi:hypothetical protein [Roseivirga echinicomitans]|uniref:Uncharacterized protein n=1 Tax=Roseivirga echinicomitans TaxID=296218 RepID=A0A150X2W0_9BACT|nr:hypothetical protein [Roseivirga echinicomitans]KYG73065.1 hypothetical protein AWN68_10260 [Roseivirga echinicomitans]